MRIGHYAPETTITLVNGRIEPPTFVTEEFRERYGYPALTDEDLFCLVFFDFSRSIKVAYLDEGPLAPQEVHARGATVYTQAQEERTRQSRARGKRRRAMNEYLECCETVLEEWRKGELHGPQGFKLSEEFVPEPYLAFDGHPLDDPDKPRLILLTTNPGGGMAFQCRTAIKAGEYRDLQATLVKRYTAPQSKYAEGERISRAATDRIEGMRRLRDELDKRKLELAPGFLQCEVIPLHSASLPDKPKLSVLLSQESGDSWLGQYLAALRRLLSTSHVVAIDATNRLDAGDEVWREPWLTYRATLMDFEHRPGRRSYTQPQGETPTVRFDGYVKDYRLARVYGLVQGGNRFAGDMGDIAEIIMANAG